ncbi:hypothetical protein GBAR_LOCUS25339, partial [Geodia barretti]
MEAISSRPYIHCEGRLDLLRLNEMVQHHFSYSSSREVRMNEEKRDIGFSDLH